MRPRPKPPLTLRGRGDIDRAYRCFDEGARFVDDRGRTLTLSEAMQALVAGDSVGVFPSPTPPGPASDS